MTTKLSLRDAILINLNVMFGTGVLINTVNLAVLAGSLGFLSYLIVAAIMLPLIFSIAQVVQLHPTGSFYAYARPLHPFLGFFSSWAYFTGKLASATLLIHVFTTLISRIIPALSHIPLLFFDIAILLFFTWLNQFNLKTGTKITYTFLVLKCTPILFALVTSFYFFNAWSLPPETFLWSGIPFTIPLVLYAFVGFEAACSLSSSIENPQKNAPRAILYSFGLVIGITVLYQLAVFALLNTNLMSAFSFLEIFPLLLSHWTITPSLGAHHFLNLLYIAAACAALGGSYGILLSNAWNLQVLAHNRHIFFADSFKKLNRYGVPFGCIMAQMMLCLFYFTVTQGHQITLQQISVLGCAIAYTLSVVGLLYKNRSTLLGWCGLASCMFLLTMCIRNVIIAPSWSMILFGTLLIIGCAMFMITNAQCIGKTN